MTEVVQFFLIDHIGATGLAVLIPCVTFKVWIIYHCKSHPLYRGSPDA